MPLYEYQCQQCGLRSEVLQRYADAPLTTCSTCGGPLKKLISSPAFQFKGSGWYVTDYARSGGAKDSGSSAKDSGSSAKKDGGDSSGGAKETSAVESSAKPSADTGGEGSKSKPPAKE